MNQTWIEGCSNFRVDAISDHNDSKMHTASFNKFIQEVDVDNPNSVINMLRKNERDVEELEGFIFHIKTILLITKKNLAFTNFEEIM